MSMNYNINLTESALKRIHFLIMQENDQNSALRIAVSGGGCSGFKYTFLMDQVKCNDFDSFDDDENDDFDDDDFDEEDEDNENYEARNHKDIIIHDNKGSPIVVVDNCSVNFLKNSTIDYTEDLAGSRFKITNSLAKSKCGCGDSFSI
ncbi:HesB/IscA family protein [Wolbachia endosymbiont of Pentidionis agamae]|uniref:HesB/IscA family protein n=1 Tax=Wolbachia endosymbiont of Pentidionis agamae TaxID=3110435 RepID=UPI002FD6CF9A